MYEQAFGLSQRPFAAAPRTDRYFPGQAVEVARKSLFRCLERAEGIGVVIGAPGTGKTLVCRLLAEQLRPRVKPLLLGCGQIGTVRGLYQMLLAELGQPYRGLDEGELRIGLMQTFASLATPVLIVVDEAHSLSPKLLDELRTFGNLPQGDESRVRLLLAGAPTLEERLAHPRLQALSQRIAVRCYLDQYSASETQDYIATQLAWAGAQLPAVASSEAIRAIHTASDGIPRLINQICDHALLLASMAGQRQLSAAIVEEAWSDLQQLPLPSMARKPQRVSNEPVVEFGSLDDGDGVPHSIPFPNVAAAELQVESSLTQIETHLADLDEDFDLNLMRPEVELIFDPNVDPFGEPFAEEEVVVDPFFQGAPAAIVAPAAPAPFSISAAAPQPVTSTAPGREPFVAAVKPAPAQSPTPWPTITLGNPASGKVVTPLRAESWQPLSAEVITKTPPAAPAIDVVEPEGADLIIVEDDTEAAVPVRPRSPVVIRRSEYRQLFAKMRRG